MKMFKKSLIAASVAVAATTAYASNITTTQQTFALEGTVAAGTVEIGNQITATLNVTKKYIANDVIEVFVTGAPVDADTVATATLGSGQTSFIDFDAADNKLRFRVETDINGTVSSPVALSLSGVDLETSSLAAGDKIAVSTRTQSLNQTIGQYDSASLASGTSLAEVKSQWSVKVDNKLDGTIDVEKSRKLFVDDSATSGTDESLADVITVSITDIGADFGTLAESKAVHVLKGADFSFLADADLSANGGNDDGELSSAELASMVTATTETAVGADDSYTYSLNSDFTELTVTQTADAAGDLDKVVSVEINAPGSSSSSSLSEQSFTADVNVFVGTDSKAGVSDADAGKWDLNGASAYVPYMPYGTGVSQILYVSNQGNQSGAIEVSAFDENGNTYGPYTLGTAAPKSITKITGDLEDALANDGFVKGKLAFTVTVTAPKASIEVYSGYNAGNDRGLVINSSNK